MARLDPPARPGWLVRLASWILDRRQGRRVGTMDVLAHNGWILGAFIGYGAFFEASKHVPMRTRRLVHLRTAMRVGCPT